MEDQCHELRLSDGQILVPDVELDNQILDQHEPRIMRVANGPPRNRQPKPEFHSLDQSDAQNEAYRAIADVFSRRGPDPSRIKPFDPSEDDIDKFHAEFVRLYGKRSESE